MFKILLADDEKIVTDAISLIIEKNFDDIIFETVRSGRDAIEKADSFKPNIVLMDIRMPGINGIDAIREIRKGQKETLFIIMSAYEQFEFAKEAVKLGVIDYLLKPINKNTIVSAIENAKEIYENERQNRLKHIESIEKYENILPYIEDNFIFFLLLGHISSKQSKKYHDILSLKYEGGYILTLELQEKNEFDIYDESLYIYIRDILKYKCTCIVGPIILSRITIFVSTNNKEEYSQRLEAVQLAEYLVGKTLESKTNVDISIGIGSYRILDDIYISYEESLKALNFGQSKDINHITDFVNDKHEKLPYPFEAEKTLIDMCCVGQKDEALIAFSELYSYVYNNYSNSFLEGKDKLIEVMVMLQRNVIQSGMNIKYYSNYLFAMEKIMDYIELERWCRERISLICEEFINQRTKNISHIIIEAKKYIKANYDKEITLDEISRHTCVSPHYFSRLFKEEAGENYIDYLTQIRIDRAKELMEKSDLSIKEICFKIGYGDPNYFSRLFKKVEKLTPSEYLKKIGEYK